MHLYGLTGGMGMGKSTVAELFRLRDIPVVDTDVIARQVVEPGQPALLEIVAAFGPAMLGPDGKLRREELARAVFGNDAARERLEAILHPRIRALWLAETQAWAAQGVARGVVVIPLLFETGATASFQSILCVACSARSQHERLAARGWSHDQITQRNRAQWPVNRKLDASHFVIWSDGPFELLGRQLDRVLARERQ